MSAYLDTILAGPSTSTKRRQTESADGESDLERSGRKRRIQFKLQSETVEPQTLFRAADLCAQISNSRDDTVILRSEAIAGKVLERLKECLIADRSTINILDPRSEIFNTICSALEEQQDITRLNLQTMIAVVGDIGAGKSSLINALLDYEQIAPACDFGGACTAVATEFRHRQAGDKKFKATVEYVTSEEFLVEAEYLVRELLQENDDEDGWVVSGKADGVIVARDCKRAVDNQTGDELVKSRIKQEFSSFTEGHRSRSAIIVYTKTDDCDASVMAAETKEIREALKPIRAEMKQLNKELKTSEHQYRSLVTKVDEAVGDRHKHHMSGEDIPLENLSDSAMDLFNKIEKLRSELQQLRIKETFIAIKIRNESIRQKLCGKLQREGFTAEIFTISSREYQRFRGRFTNSAENVPSFKFLKVEQTEIPDLQEYLQQFVIKRKKHSIVHFLRFRIEQILRRLETTRHFNDHRRIQPLDSTVLREGTRALARKLHAQKNEFIQQLFTTTEEMVKFVLDEGNKIVACAKLEEIVNNWHGARCTNRIWFPALKAAIIRDGLSQNIDLNQLFVQPLYTAIDSHWNQFLSPDCISIWVVSYKKSINEFHRSILDQFDVTSQQQLSSIGEILLLHQAEFEQVHATEVKNFWKQQAEFAYMMLPDTLQNSLRETYAKCQNITGRQSTRKWLNILIHSLV
ncbi:hypothetical protein K440DRAFT_639272 [Wilcoxina mikolae CBS 423.85]|nr:hypothetical protein K440DRAFT_639272 [Wilcoxina mikolae CBS 423.85]